jgi:HAMP domain-containing protein
VPSEANRLFLNRLFLMRWLFEPKRRLEVHARYQERLRPEDRHPARVQLPARRRELLWAEGEVTGVSDARLWHPWLGINRVLSVMPAGLSLTS